MLKRIEKGLELTIFWSRWLQAPIYVGLIVAQILYCYKFGKEVVHLVQMTESSNETTFLVLVLTLIDIAMVANLLTMVVIGGYATFVSKLDLDETTDRPDWLAHIDPGAIKIKLASSLVGISSIHLLKSFVYVGNPQLAAAAIGIGAGDTGHVLTHEDIMWQIIIHMVFVFSALLLAFTEFIVHRRYPAAAAPLRAHPDMND
jgi:uncharacterized protein (TIGR00645 family)